MATLLPQTYFPRYMCMYQKKWGWWSYCQLWEKSCCWQYQKNILYIYLPYVSTVPDSLHQRLLAKNKKLRITLNQNLISQLYFHSTNPNGNFNPRGGQVLIDSMKVSQMGSISFPICKCALSAWLSFFISIPLFILSAFCSLLFFCNNLCILKIYGMSRFMLMKSNSIVLLWSF